MTARAHARKKPKRRHWIIGSSTLACAAGAAVAGVLTTGGSGAPRPPTATHSAPKKAAAAATTADEWTQIATTKGTIPRYATPGGPADGTIPATWYGGVSSLPVIADKPGWLDVRLPTRPNGSTAWVRQGDVSLTESPYRIKVDVTTRRLTLFNLGQKVMDVAAGVGTASDPTPTGQFFAAFLEQSPSAGYGPFIMVTSAHSTTITDWEGSGDAVIGIHGPLGDESLIGNTGAYLSHGCIRIPIPDLDQLRIVPAGSPISIVK